MKQQREGGFLIARIHQLAGRVFSRMLREHDVAINPAQGRILFVLWRDDEIPITELSKRTSLEKSTLTSMLDRLEEAGYITRVPSKEDRRKILITRTDKDRACQATYVEASQEMTELYYAGFSEREIERVEGDVRRILHNLGAAETPSS